MFISHGIWMLRTRSLRREAKEADLTFDTYPPAIEWQEKSFSVPINRPRKFSRAYLPGEPLNIEADSESSEGEREEAVV